MGMAALLGNRCDGEFAASLRDFFVALGQTRS